MNLPRLIASHAAALGCDHGAETSMPAAMLSTRASSSAESRGMVGSGGTVPEYSLRPSSEET
ncbi:hypothetical protein [Nocardioides sp. YIM 152315]|uniref:hypothetical protein n=1 Tax=Nocardioides sp. YIM 152315 TaxID=3031760 RepID=UPI0023DC8F04|nr:hypothetical protein [Nocardioides sp. YIM 152315]MDF1604906.1 hypothetical protein [Nocardioides sp. YIM 152315]